MLIRLCPLFLLLLSSSAAAQSACWQLDDERQRLACYDQQQVEKPVQQRRQSSDDWLLTGDSSAAGYSLLNERWELDNDLGEFIFRAYKPVYFSPFFYSDPLNTLPTTDNPDTSSTEALDLDHLEAKFQLSFKTKLANDLIGDNADLWLGYTQSSYWQIYNAADSRPFRETNHEPEIMLVWRSALALGPYTMRLISLSLNHQSNGRQEPLSRSWNRVILSLGFDRRNWVLMIRPWYRIQELDDEDENPKILDYIGRGEVLLVHRRRNSHQISTLLRHSLKDGADARGSIQLNWSYPCFDRLRCHAQIFHGYGESLIDFNHRSTSVGLGIALLEWF